MLAGLSRELGCRGKSPEICADRGSAGVRLKDFALLVPLSLSTVRWLGSLLARSENRVPSGVVHLAGN